MLRIEYVTEAGTFTHAKDAIRSSLKYINASGNPANLLSTLFFIEPVKSRGNESEGGFRVYIATSDKPPVVGIIGRR